MSTDPVADPLETATTGDLGLKLLEVVRDLLDSVVTLGSAEQVDAVLRLLSWDPELLQVSEPIAGGVARVDEALRPLRAAVDLQRAPAIPEITSALATATPKIAGLVEAVNAWSPPPGAPPGTTDVLVADLLKGLPWSSFAARFPISTLALRLAGALVDEPVGELRLADGTLLRAGGSRLVVDPNAFARLLRDPLGALRVRLLDDGSGGRRSPAAVSDLVASLVTDPLMLAGVPTRYPLRPDQVPAALAVSDAASRLLAVRIPFTDSASSVPSELRLIAGLTDDTGGEGLGLLVAADGSLSTKVRAGSGVLTAHLQVGDEPVLVTGRGVRLARPGSTGLPSVSLTVGYGSGELVPVVRLGVAGGTRFEVDHVAVEIKGSFDGQVPDVGASVALTGMRLVIQASEGDGFLATALGGRAIESTFDLGLAWSFAKGLQIRGAASLPVELAINADLGPIHVNSVWLALRVAADGSTPAITLELAASISLGLGPFAASVDRIGLAGRLTFPPQPGNIGPGQLDLAFKPPVGVGIAIDTLEVSGGGFLFLDSGAGRYAGVFELTLLDVVSVKAVALISTKLPDGRPGFALLIMITAEGFTPVPLGLGFELTGVGGLLALNRTVDADAVRGGLRDGVLDSILFVKDPAHNATRLLATLDRVFPAAPDRLLIGPLAEISWASPPILHIRLALLLEVPQPIRAVLVAAVSVTLPHQQDAVVELHVDAIGVLDLARGELALDASLHHSRLLSFTLSGDLALRLSWGAAPTFLLSVGGFHPQFPPPAGLRPLNRVALSLTGSDNPRVRMEAYLALTSNSIQLGARVSLYAEAGGFGIDGGGAFDALVQWSPFHVDVAFQAWVRVFGPTGTLLAARVAVDVSGPGPWHVTGVVELQVLFVTVKVGVDLSVGDAASQRPIETADVAALLWEQVSRTASWQATLAGSVAPGVTLRPASSDADPAASPLVVHPLATLTLRQQVVPLATPIARVGARLPKHGTRSYHLDVVVPPGVLVDGVNELFAPAQFVEVAEDAKLLGPAFAPLPAGVSLRPETARVAAQDGVAATDLTFETLEVTDLDQPATIGTPADAVAASALPGAHAGEASRRADGRVRAGWQVVAS